MEAVAKKQFQSRLPAVRQGSVFIYPTDTIYGIGCDATNEKAVLRIRDAKQRDSKPFSVIAPSKKWVLENCEVPGYAKKWLSKLPGPYTLVLKLKKKSAVANSVSDTGTLGVRIPKHWISAVVAGLGFPVVSTSANVSGRLYMTCLDDIDPSVKKKVDFIVYAGKKSGRPSTIVKLTGGKAEVVER